MRTVARATGRPRGSRDRHGKAVRAVAMSERYARQVEAIGDRIRAIREEKDISASELAAACGVDASTVRYWEQGNTRRLCSIRRLVQVATALDCMLLDLMPSEEP